MRVEYVFDTVCPWCYVGKRRLERALAQRPNARIAVQWRPFLLNPDLPSDGVDRKVYLDRKFGGQARVQRVHAAVAAAAQMEGITFDFDAITKTPNSLASHRLIRLAGGIGREGEAVESLYRAYFVEGLDIGDHDVLAALGAGFGLDLDATRAYLRSDADVTTVLNDNARAHRLGVNGVPCLIIDGSYALAGAQEPDILLRLIDIVRENETDVALS